MRRYRKKKTKKYRSKYSHLPYMRPYYIMSRWGQIQRQRGLESR